MGGGLAQRRRGAEIREGGVGSTAFGPPRWHARSAVALPISKIIVEIEIEIGIRIEVIEGISVLQGIRPTDRRSNITAELCQNGNNMALAGFSCRNPIPRFFDTDTDTDTDLDLASPSTFRDHQQETADLKNPENGMDQAIGTNPSRWPVENASAPLRETLRLRMGGQGG